MLWINITPYFTTELPKTCEGFTEELAEEIGCGFTIELSTDKQARYNPDPWERLEYRVEFRKVTVDSQCSHYSLFDFELVFIPMAINLPMKWVIQAVTSKFVGL